MEDKFIFWWFSLCYGGMIIGFFLIIIFSFMKKNGNLIKYPKEKCVIEKCLFCGIEFVVDSEYYLRHLQIHKVKKELGIVETKEENKDKQIKMLQEEINQKNNYISKLKESSQAELRDCGTVGF